MKGFAWTRFDTEAQDNLKTAYWPWGLTGAMFKVLKQMLYSDES